MAANARPYGKAARITAEREVERCRRVWQLRSVVAMREEQQKASGAKDLWVQVVPIGAGRRARPRGPVMGAHTERGDEGGWPTRVGDMRHRRACARPTADHWECHR